MGAPEANTTLIYGIHLRESATDGSDFSNAATDYRVVFLGEDGELHAKDSAGSVTALGGGGSGTTDHAVCQGRLTLTSGTAVTTADVTAAATLYFTPFRGNLVGTYDGAAWSVSAFTEKSISLAALTADTNYDIFIVDSTLALEATAWTNATTRATALASQDGVLVKSGATTRRYLGTIRIVAAGGACEDSLLKRYVWNYYNRVERLMQVFDGTNSWTYGTAAWRQARATAGNQVEYVCGVSENPVRAQVQCGANNSGSLAGAVGIGIDATNANSAQFFTETYLAGPTDASTARHATYRGWPGIGYHYVAWLEYARSGTNVFIGDNGVADMQSGLVGEMLG